MAQRSIEILLGRLITDEAFRAAFLRDPAGVLRSFIDSGHELTAVEVLAVRNTRPGLWGIVAEEIDPRLQKARLAGA